MYPKLLSNTHSRSLLLTLTAKPSFHASSPSPNFLNFQLQQHKLKPHVRCALNTTNGNDGTSGSAKSWEKWLPRNLFAAEDVFVAISRATSSPIAQYISSPTTFLHTVDPRIKMAWLLALFILPARANIAIRTGVVVYLVLLSIWSMPAEVWKDQLGRVTLVCGILFILLGLSTDSAPSLLSSRSPPSSLTGLTNPPASFEGYKYVVLKFGPVQLTRKGISAASAAATLTFTIFQSASLCLTTTTPEQLAFAFQWFIRPLARLGVPVAEVILTLLLSLRFISLVFDEVRNVALGIVSRRIQWQQLTTLETTDVFFSYLRRVFKNMYNHAEQIAQAMIVRGFRGDCNSHKVLLSAGSSTAIANAISLSCLVGLIGAVSLSTGLSV